ncbi:hypothetical protein JHK82_011525 [Glycine max]|nr:hypothetical protein JHK87_011408 [Glycine soja]KAG5039371.1 hypothetical protein JHK85_011847 [Glycine max]KAG5056520.1 hypothetical protein JHK86_011516 [Glycine max]KAG5153556.1 hypothetical protein JHK82_011525 [Glycine max]KHN15185.1 hypothetical protein glysoja_011803 [Glycine soja]
MAKSTIPLETGKSSLPTSQSSCTARYRISSRVGSLRDYLCLKSVIISSRQLMILEYPASISILMF